MKNLTIKEFASMGGKAKLDKNCPRQGKPTQLSFDYATEEADDTGKGL